MSYRKVLLHRNKLLKDIAEAPEKADQLDPWDKLLIDHGVRIIRERRSFIDSIIGGARNFYSVFDSVNELTLDYSPRVSSEKPDLMEAMSYQLREYRGREIRAGLTLVGPHRDRLIMNLKGKSVRHYGSRGQKRCVMLALKLAVADFLSNANGRDVILILDEVFAELDGEKSRALMNALSGYRQVFIATAGELSFDKTKYKRFLVEDGKIEEISG